MADTITVGDLRERLEKGEKVTVLDVRDKDDFAEWRIPGAINLDAYDALSAGQPGPLAAYDVPRGVPVVTVCYAGNTSRRAAEYLRERGLDAVSLEGGMNAWTMAWNVAEIALPGSSTRLLQVRRTGKGCLSYMLANGGECVVIDASLDVELYVDLARKNGWRIARVVDTHIHADHLSRSRALASRAGATIHMPRTERARYPHEPVDEGTRIPFGATALVALRTPGHTPESTCYQLEGKLLFTGDTLFVDAVGRPDLEASPAQAKTRAIALHATLQRLQKLPPETIVLPGHSDAPVPFDRRPLLAELRQVKLRTPTLARPLDEFVARLTTKLPEAPPNHHAIVKANEAGETQWTDVTKLEAGANRCAVK